MSHRLQQWILSVGICFGTTILVISIRGGFDAVPPRRVSPQPGPPTEVSHEALLARFDQDADVGPDESADVSPTAAFMFMMLGKSGSFGLPGVMLPTVEPAISATTDDDAQIIGVEVDGQCRAYCISEMQSPFTHVVNDVVGGVPVTVTYCDRSNCARVLTQSDESNAPLGVGVGGFRDSQMLLHIDRRNFSQNAPEVPLQDLEFERMTWKEWKTAHPDTDVCDHLDPTGIENRPRGASDVAD